MNAVLWLLLAGTAGMPTDPVRGHLLMPRYAPALATDGTAVFVTGGAPQGAHRSGSRWYSGVHATIERLDPADPAGRWEALSLQPRANHAAVWHQGQVWILGGRATVDGGGSVALDSVEAYDPKDKSFGSGPALPVALHNPAAVSLDGRLYVLGGIQSEDSQPNRRVFRLDRAASIWETVHSDMPDPAEPGGTVAIGGQIWVLGGWNGSTALASVRVFDTATNTWRSARPLPLPTSANASVADGDEIYLFGDYGEQSRVMRYSTTSETTRLLEVDFTPRRHVRAALVADRIVVVGGNQDSLGSALDLVEVFDLESLRRAPEKEGQP